MYCELDHGGGTPLDHTVIQNRLRKHGSFCQIRCPWKLGEDERVIRRECWETEYQVDTAVPWQCEVVRQSSHLLLDFRWQCELVCQTSHLLLDAEGTKELTLVLVPGGSFTVDRSYDCSFEDTIPHGKDVLGVVVIRLGPYVVLRACVAQSRSGVASFKVLPPSRKTCRGRSSLVILQKKTLVVSKLFQTSPSALSSSSARHLHVAKGWCRPAV